MIMNGNKNPTEEIRTNATEKKQPDSFADVVFRICQETLSEEINSERWGW